MVKKYNACYVGIFLCTLIIDFFYYIGLSIMNDLSNCKNPFGYTYVNKIVFPLFWTVVIICSLPIKSTKYDFLTFLYCVAITAFNSYIIYKYPKHNYEKDPQPEKDVETVQC
jgi:hypothetical protein